MVAQGKVIWMNFGTNSVFSVAYQFWKTQGRGFMGPVIQRPKLYLQLVSWARLTPSRAHSQCIGSCFSHLSMVIPRVICSYGLVLSDIKRLVLTAKNFHPEIFSGWEHKSLLTMLLDSFSTAHTKRKNKSGSWDKPSLSLYLTKTLNLSIIEVLRFPFIFTLVQ